MTTHKELAAKLREIASGEATFIAKASVIREAADALDAAQEPVAWYWREQSLFEKGLWLNRLSVERPEENKRVRDVVPLYAAPPAPTSPSGEIVEALKTIKARADIGGRHLETAQKACDDIEALCDAALSRLPQRAVEERDLTPDEQRFTNKAPRSSVKIVVTTTPADAISKKEGE